MGKLINLKKQIIKYIPGLKEFIIFGRRYSCEDLEERGFNTKHMIADSPHESVGKPDDS